MSDGATAFTLRDGEATLRVRVTPRSTCSRAGGIVHDADGRAALAIRVTVPPEKGKANKEVITTLAKSLKLAKSRLTITAGLANRNKIIAIAGDPADFRTALLNLLASDAED